ESDFSEARFYVFRGETESVNENEHSSVHSAHKCILQEDRESCCRCCALVYVLQLLPRAHYAPSDASTEASISNHVWTIDELCGWCLRWHPPRSGLTRG